jgi:hypothetical protein
MAYYGFKKTDTNLHQGFRIIPCPLLEALTLRELPHATKQRNNSNAKMKHQETAFITGIL